MKIIVFIIIILYANNVYAAESMVDAILNNKICKEAVKKDYTKANETELRCLSIYNYSKALKKHQSYRDFGRIKILRSMKKITNKMNKPKRVFKDIIRALQTEIHKNEKNLSRIKIFGRKIVYFDAEISPDGVYILYGYDDGKIIKLNSKILSIVHEKTGNTVYVCPTSYECVKMKGFKEKEFYSYDLNKISIQTEYGTSEINNINRKNSKFDLIYLAHEIYAQLYNKKAEKLSKIKIEFTQPPSYYYYRGKAIVE